MAKEPARRFIRSYEDLDVYQRAMNFLVPVHEVVLGFPPYERYDLASQIRRAAKSIPANIGEGYGKKRSAKEFQSYLSNALGSATELEIHLKIAAKLGYLSELTATELIGECEIIGRQLYRLMQHWRTLETSPLTSHLQEPPQ